MRKRGEAQGADAAAGAPGFLRGIWLRIKEHKVVQWTLAYLAVAYTLLHGAEMLSHSFTWPHALLRAFAAVLILGIPVVIAVSWYHGTHGRERVSATEIMIIAMLLAVGGALVWRDVCHLTALTYAAVESMVDNAPVTAVPDRI